MSPERFYSKVNGPTLHRVNAVRWLDEVTPRHLADGGDPRHVTEYLLASGWSNHSVPGYPHVLLESPDRRLHLTLEPEEDEFMSSWRVHPAQGHAWSAKFGIHTPVEIISGFTDALHSTGPRPEEAELWRLAASHGWTMRLAWQGACRPAPGRDRLPVPRVLTRRNTHPPLGSSGLRTAHRETAPVDLECLHRRSRPARSPDRVHQRAHRSGPAATAGRGRNRGTPSASSTPAAAPSHRNSTACSICGASKPLNAPAPPRPRRHHPD